MTATGKISFWNEEKGFGFIRPDSGGDKIFVHITAFKVKNHRPELGKSVTYRLSSDEQGRARAIGVIFVGDAASPHESASKTNPRWPMVLLAISFLSAVGFLISASKIPPWCIVLYTGASLFTFVIYAKDKFAAQRGYWRTKESTLHFLSIIGGWPGALIAQQILRHKSKKQSFRGPFWISVFLNCMALGLLFTPAGSSTYLKFISNHRHAIPSWMLDHDVFIHAVSRLGYVIAELFQ